MRETGTLRVASVCSSGFLLEFGSGKMGRKVMFGHLERLKGATRHACIYRTFPL